MLSRKGFYEIEFDTCQTQLFHDMAVKALSYELRIQPQIIQLGSLCLTSEIHVTSEGFHRENVKLITIYF